MRGANPGDVWKFSHVHYSNPNRQNHPTQKPTSLLKRIVLASSNPGDVVLDPFSGSFTTGDVSKSLDRRFIGIEINEEYVKMGIRRLNIPSSYTPKELEKLKKRKTNGKKKYCKVI